MPFLLDPQTLSQLGTLIGLTLTTALILLDPGWRTGLFALAFQYVLLTLLLTTIVHPAVASVRLLSGVPVVLMLYITMRRVAMANRAIPPQVLMAIYGEQAPPNPPVFSVGLAFRFLAGAFVAVAMIGVAASMTFLSLPAFVLFGSLWLIAAGILVATLSRDPLRLGLGILIFSGGFNVLETATDGGLFLYGLLNISDLLLALVIAHLALLPHDVEEGIRREVAMSQTLSEPGVAVSATEVDSPREVRGGASSDPRSPFKSARATLDANDKENPSRADLKPAGSEVNPE